MLHLIAVLPSLTKCASLFKSETEALPVDCRRDHSAKVDTNGADIYICGPDGTILFIYSVSWADLRKYLPSLALELTL